MTTISIPINSQLDEFIEEQVKLGNVASKADLIRRAIVLYKEEQVLSEILKAQREIKTGKGIEFLGKTDFKNKIEKIYGKL
jgi:Arc/MetJ-type ribon-helix-helix transcriptional regulator